jgi:hypothetical protein
LYFCAFVLLDPDAYDNTRQPFFTLRGGGSRPVT